MAKLKALMMDAENAVLHVADAAWDKVKDDLPLVWSKEQKPNHVEQFIRNVVQALKDVDHPLADSAAVEYIAYQYVRQEIYGYDYDE